MNIINQLNDLDIYYNKDIAIKNIIFNDINTDDFITNIFDNYQIIFPIIKNNNNDPQNIYNKINNITIKTIIEKSYFSTIVLEKYIKDLFKHIMKQVVAKINLNDIDIKEPTELKDIQKLNKFEKLLLIDKLILEYDNNVLNHYEIIIQQQEKLNKINKNEILIHKIFSDIFFIDNNFKEFNINKYKHEINIKNESVIIDSFKERITNLKFILTNSELIQQDSNINLMCDILFNLVPVIDFSNSFNFDNINIDVENEFNNLEIKNRVHFLFKLIDLNIEIIKLENLSFKTIYCPIYKNNKIYKIIYLWSFLFFFSENSLKHNLINIIISLLVFLRRDLNFKNKKVLYYYLYLLNKFDLIEIIIDNYIFK